MKKNNYNTKFNGKTYPNLKLAADAGNVKLTSLQKAVLRKFRALQRNRFNVTVTGVTFEIEAFSN